MTRGKEMPPASRALLVKGVVLVILLAYYLATVVLESAILHH